MLAASGGNFMDDFSFEYRRAIAAFAQSIIDNQAVKETLQNLWNSGAINYSGSTFWEDCLKHCPDLRSLWENVQDRLDYELSYSQLCNGVWWACSFQPQIWVQYLNQPIPGSAEWHWWMSK